MRARGPGHEVAPGLALNSCASPEGLAPFPREHITALERGNAASRRIPRQQRKRKGT